MNSSFVSATLQATSVMNRGSGIVIGAVSAQVENFVRERAPSGSSRSASLSRRCPQSRCSRLCAAVHALPSRVGRPRRGPTSEIPDGLMSGSALGLRALAGPARANSVRPNYAFERTGEPSARARVRQVQPLRPSARLRRRVPAAQRER